MILKNSRMFYSAKKEKRAQHFKVKQGAQHFFFFFVNHVIPFSKLYSAKSIAESYMGGELMGVKAKHEAVCVCNVCVNFCFCFFFH